MAKKVLKRIKKPLQPRDVADKIINTSSPDREKLKKEVTDTIEARHKSVEDDAKNSNINLMQYGDDEFYDENGNQISTEEMNNYRKTVATYFENFVVLTDIQKIELAEKLPKSINNDNVEVGHKSVYPPCLDNERRKVANSRIIHKAQRLKYIESETKRGLHMGEDLDELVKESSNVRKNEKAMMIKKDLVRQLMALNYNDYEMCEYLKISSRDLSKFKKEVVFEEVYGQKQMTNEERYAIYKLQQMEVVKDLDVVIERHKNSKQLTALTSAMKAKSEIYNDIIQKGYEFGVIEKTPDKSAVLIGNIDLNTASLDEIRSELEKTNKQIEKISKSDDFLNS